MNFRTTYILFGVLGVVLVLFGFVLWRGPGPSTDVSSYVLPGLHPEGKAVKAEEIERLVIDRRGEKLVFVRDANAQTWKMTQPHEFRVNPFEVSQVVNQVINAAREEKADVSNNPRLYDLEDPAASVTLFKGDQEWRLNLGREGKGEGAVVYVTSSERKEPMAVRRSTIDALFKTVNDFRAKDLLAESGFDIQSVDVRDAKQGPVVLTKASEGRWRFEKPEGFGLAQYQSDTPSIGADAAAKQNADVSSLLQALSNVRVEATDDFVEADAKDLGKYGLEEGKQAGLRIEVKRNAGGLGGGDKPPVTVVLLTGKEVSEKGDEVYARRADEKHVVKVEKKNLQLVSTLLEKPTEFRDRDLVHLDTGRVDALDLKTASGQAIELRRLDPGQWKMWVDGGTAQDVHEQAVQELLTTLTGKRLIKDFPDPKSKDADLGLDKPTAVVTLWEDAVQKDEKKEEAKPAEKGDEKKEEKTDPAKPSLKADQKDKPAVRLTFGARDVNKGVVYVRRESGEDTTLLAVQDSVLQAVTKGHLAYRERSLRHFDREEDVTKLAVTRPDGTYEVVKETKDGKDVWKFTQPKDMAGRTAGAFAVRDILGTLRFLNVVELAAERPAEGELEKYGLKSPQVTVTVTTTTKDNKTEEHVYLFGKDAANGVYAKQGKGDLVFVTGKETLRPLTASLQDPTVFTFDAAKVKTLKLVGWQDVVGAPVTLDLERKSAQDWAVKAPPNFNLDAGKVQKLVADLSNLRAEEFVDPKKAPAAEQFDPKAGALLIELTLEGEKEPLTLTVDGLDADKKRYFARSNRVPGQTFLVARERFEDAKSKPAAFSK